MQIWRLPDSIPGLDLRSDHLGDCTSLVSECHRSELSSIDISLWLSLGIMTGTSTPNYTVKYK